MKFFIMLFPHVPVSSFLLGQKSEPQIPSVNVLPLIWDTKFHTHIRHQVKLYFVYFNLVLLDKVFWPEWQQTFAEFNLLLT
jgi:hypothetical protein